MNDVVGQSEFRLLYAQSVIIRYASQVSIYVIVFTCKQTLVYIETNNLSYIKMQLFTRE